MFHEKYGPLATCTHIMLMLLHITYAQIENSALGIWEYKQ